MSIFSGLKLENSGFSLFITVQNHQIDIRFELRQFVAITIPFQPFNDLHSMSS
ncbi:hypothetical protein [Bifidobacterium sp.]|uniref:hypothetical protein n=1 Tax=Bifidobacterium sp. TaxID=41200 RepID=UPI0025BBF22C|nr:hypothetical protein [Bifidobacterium sp.]MCI1635084.1 hypothetical protein [Bifidobacterium sp.]